MLASWWSRPRGQAVRRWGGRAAWVFGLPLAWWGIAQQGLDAKGAAIACTLCMTVAAGLIAPIYARGVHATTRRGYWRGACGLAAPWLGIMLALAFFGAPAWHWLALWFASLLVGWYALAVLVRRMGLGPATAIAIVALLALVLCSSHWWGGQIALAAENPESRMALARLVTQCNPALSVSQTWLDVDSLALPLIYMRKLTPLVDYTLPVSSAWAFVIGGWSIAAIAAMMAKRR